jgi:tetratricopeptide (TPR) repeat protein
MCSLLPGLDVDRNQLVEIADAALQQNPASSFLKLGKGAALYRVGQYEQALELLPVVGAPNDNPKDALLPLVFRAMAHAQLGDAYTARKALDVACQQIQQSADTPDGPEMPFQDRPVVWCMIQCLLREARSVVPPPVTHQELPTGEAKDLSEKILAYFPGKWDFQSDSGMGNGSVHWQAVSDKAALAGPGTIDTAGANHCLAGWDHNGKRWVHSYFSANGTSGQLEVTRFEGRTFFGRVHHTNADGTAQWSNWRCELLDDDHFRITQDTAGKQAVQTWSRTGR